MALAGLFFAGCAIVLAQSARLNNRGMIINGIVRLDIDEANIFLWILAGLSVLFVAAGIYGVARSLGPFQEIVIDGKNITAPKGGLSSTIVSVPFASIFDLQIVQVKSQRFLTIRHRDGKLIVNRAMMPSHEDFEELVAEVAERCRAEKV